MDEPERPERAERPAHSEHPIMAGLLAMVAVALVVGVVFGVGASMATKSAGLSDDGAGSGGRTQKETLYLPDITMTETESGPRYTIGTDEPEQTETSSSEPTTKTEEAAAISLTALQTDVAVMGRIDLTGSYDGGEGAILRVQQRVGDGEWQDFPVTIPVSGDTFSTYIQTGQVGTNQIRVVDTELDKMSNEVTVKVG